jgi:hypothetical protein
MTQATDTDSHEDPLGRIFKDSETAFAAALEQSVQGDAFGELLARTTENAMAVTKLAFGVADAIVRNLRLAGRADMNRLGHQLARTEDKLELVLQELEALRAETRSEAPPPAP